MGDRCYMTMQIGGEITDADMLEQVLEAIQSDCGRPNDYPESKSNAAYLRKCAVNGETPEFYFQEVNYADLDCAGAIADLGLDVYTWNEAGGGYPAGHCSWNGVTGEKFAWDDADDGNIRIDVLDKIMGGPEADRDKLTKIREAIEKAKQSQWVDTRPFGFSQELLNEGGGAS